MDAAGFTRLRGLWFATKASDRQAHGHLKHVIMEVTATSDARGFFAFCYDTSDFNIESQSVEEGIQHQLKPHLLQI